jgi:hypothetical protein
VLLRQPRHAQALIALLSKLARNQVADACRKFLHCPRHHPDREQSLSDATGQEPKNLPAKQASASQIFEAKELEEGLPHGQSPLNQEILGGLGLRRDALTKRLPRPWGSAKRRFAG